MTARSDKKARERGVLRQFYPAASFVEAEADCESPDFILRENSRTERIGVEVTDFFASGTDARFARLRNYVSALLAGARPRHKDDEGLIVDRLTVHSPDGTFQFATKGIQREAPIAGTLSRLASLIGAKGKKHESFRKDVAHHNLLIANQSVVLSDRQPGDFFAVLFSSNELRDAVLRSPFREIFVLTSAAEEQRVCIPLKQLLLAGLTKLYGVAITRYLETQALTKTEGSFTSLAQYLTRQGATVYCRTTDDKVEVFFGNCSAVNDQDEHVTITCYFETALPFDMELVRDTGNSNLDEFFATVTHTVEDTTVRDLPIAFKVAVSD